MKHRIAVIMGSDSDLPHLESCIATLKEFGQEPLVRILSAHRTPDDLARFVEESEKDGVPVFIAAAGGAAHLAGAVAARTTLPVIGVPIPAGPLSGMDSLLATVQMPSGIPVASMAVGLGGGTNAALFALQILGIKDKEIGDRLKKHRMSKADAVRKKNSKLKT